MLHIDSLNRWPVIYREQISNQNSIKNMDHIDKTFQITRLKICEKYQHCKFKLSCNHIFLSLFLVNTYFQHAFQNYQKKKYFFQYYLKIQQFKQLIDQQWLSMNSYHNHPHPPGSTAVVQLHLLSFVNIRPGSSQGFTRQDRRQQIDGNLK